MRGRLVFLVPVFLVLVACPDDGASPGASSATLELQQTEPRSERFIDAPALVRYCERDSVLSVVTVAEPWSGAIALRTPWPPLTRFTIDSIRRDPGFAAFALRRVDRDTVGHSLMVHAGTIELDTGATLTGRISAEAGFDSLLRKLTGRFEAARVDRDGCPS